MSDISTDTYLTFGGFLKHLRRRARLTQQELGIAVGYSESYITRLESDSRMPVPAVVKSLFIEALSLEREPELAARLIELAGASRDHAHGEGSPAAGRGTQRRSNLPMQLTRFIGRARERAEVIRLIQANRLVTLTGSGGVGKTRLAQEVAAELLAQFPAGVWLIEFAPHPDPALVPQVVAAALKLPNRPSPWRQEDLCAQLAGGHMLLIFDNCEHLIQACAEVAERLLRMCPKLRILATSRECLHVPGELTWRVPSLDAAEAVQLFTDRALLARPDFVLDDTNIGAISSIGAQLDGIPLAIELAASRVAGLSVDQLATRLGDRFRLLSGGSRTVLRRHQTLRALVDWSHDLLSDQERILFRRLAVFTGGWTADAAERVCGAPRMGAHDVPDLASPNVVPLLLNLVAKSLVVVDERHTDTRYRLLETMRQYALEKLAASGELDLLRNLHAQHALAMVLDSAPRAMRDAGTPIQFVLAAGSVGWVKQLASDYDNLRAALVWCLREARDPNTGIQLALWLTVFWLVHGPRSEAIDWLDMALAYCAGEERLKERAMVLTARADFAHAAGDWSRSEQASAEALAIFRSQGDRFGIICGLMVCFNNAFHRAAYGVARDLGEEWLAIARSLHNARYEGIALFWVGIAWTFLGDPATAARYYDESLRAIPEDEIGTRVVARYYQAMGWWSEGDGARAMTCWRDVLAYFRATGFEFGTATVLHTMGDVELQAGNPERAREHYVESADTLYRIGARQRILWPIAGLAAVSAAQGQQVRAAVLWAAAEALRAEQRMRNVALAHPDYQCRVHAGLATLSAQTRASAEAAGSAMSLEQAVAHALAA